MADTVTAPAAANADTPTPAAPCVLNGVAIDATFAEAFPMRATRLIVTAHHPTWALHAGVAATGFATSVIACGCEAGIERVLAPDETPDGRPGVALLFFAVSSKELAKQIERRVGQCVLTCPTTAVYAGLPLAAGEPMALGKNLRFFGDGWQSSKVIQGVRYWRVPVMDGEFVAQETTPLVKGVGGGNLLLLATDTDAALAGAEAAVAAMKQVPGRALVDLALGYRFSKEGSLLEGLEIQGNVTNLFDKKYIGTVGQNGYTFSDPNGTLQSMLVGAPRQVFISVRKRF